jgi:hypothetical protein
MGGPAPDQDLRALFHVLVCERDAAGAYAARRHALESIEHSSEIA